MPFEPSLPSSWSAPGCCLEAETKCLSWCTEMGSPGDVAVRKHCPAAALEQDGASGDILHGHWHTKYSCKVPQLLARGHHSSDNSQDCVCQDRWLNSVEEAGAQLSLCTDLCSYKPAGRWLPAWGRAKWLLTEPGHRLNTTGTVGEGREARPCGPAIWEHRSILRAGLCQWGWTTGRDLIWNNGTLSVNGTLLLQEAEKPKGSTGERSRRDGSAQRSWWDTDNPQWVTRATRATQSRGHPALCSHCAKGPCLGNYSHCPSTHTHVFRRKKTTNCSKCDSLHFTLLSAFHCKAMPQTGFLPEMKF